MPLGLNIYAIKTQSIFINDAVHATIPRSPQLLCCVFMRPAISHGNEKIDDYLLKECWRILPNSIKQFGLKSRVKGCKCIFNLLLRS